MNELHDRLVRAYQNETGDVKGVYDASYGHISAVYVEWLENKIGELLK